MDIIDRFLNEDWDEPYDTESFSSWKHFHEFGFRYHEDNKECQGNHTRTCFILNSMGYNEDDITEMLDWFRENGRFCDCEVYLNVIEPRVRPTIMMSEVE